MLSFLNKENPWTEEEKKIFLEKFMLFPRNFEKVGGGIKSSDTKTCGSGDANYFLALDIHLLGE